MTEDRTPGVPYSSPSSSGSIPPSSSNYRSYASRASEQNAYVRQPRHHATQPAVDDFKLDPEVDQSAIHDSSFTLNQRNPIQSRSYRRARSEQAKFSQGNKYGQYLSVPKGNREIFASRERQSAQRKAIIGIIVAALIIILLIVLWPK